MKRTFKLFLKTLLILFVIITAPNYYSVIYEFKEGHKFQGNQFYNPYSNTNGFWIKVNLHAHTRAFAGGKYGRRNAS